MADQPQPSVCPNAHADQGALLPGRPGSASKGYFGDRGGIAWADAMTALHTFAMATDCPLGSDVVKWFGEKTVEFHEAVRQSRLAGGAGSNPSPYSAL